jgi:hypothetical protein
MPKHPAEANGVRDGSFLHVDGNKQMIYCYQLSIARILYAQHTWVGSWWFDDGGLRVFVAGDGT